MKMWQEQAKGQHGWQSRWQEAISQMRTIRLIGSMIWRSGPLLVVLLFAAMFVQGLIPALQLLASKQIIDHVTVGNGRISMIWAWAYAISMVFMVLLLSVQKWISKILAERSMLAINLLLLDAWEKVPGMKLYDQKKYRNRLEALQDSANWLPAQIIALSASFMTGLVSLISIVVAGWEFVLDVSDRASAQHNSPRPQAESVCRDGLGI
ncbi:ABC transporter ATP-binding protein [Paenibacillus vortex]|uniref:ABC transporter ATP-binding protein n=1 Tax=Paenibacillus vortex TaxID=71995 RepID=UPI00059273EF|nr:ABC transporter ATP-binding protein [Paenibacillus vortex]